MRVQDCIVIRLFLWYTVGMNESELYKRTNAKTLAGAYLFEGAEELTKQQAVDRITALLDPGFSDLNLKRQKEPDVIGVRYAVRDDLHGVRRRRAL